MTPLEERSVTDLMRFEIQIDAELNTTAAERRLIIPLTETNLCYLFFLTVFRWDGHIVLITKGIYSYRVSDSVRGSEKVLSQLHRFGGWWWFYFCFELSQCEIQ